MENRDIRILNDTVRNYSASVAGIMKEIEVVVEMVGNNNHCSPRMSSWLKFKLSEMKIKCKDLEEELARFNLCLKERNADESS